MANAIDNTDPEGKIAVRNYLLNTQGGPSNCNVMELFGGEGFLYDSCYTQVKKHIAFDLRAIDRPGWVKGDNRILLKSRVNGWDLYDVDSYGNPWILCNDICRMRDDGIFSMAVTCGMYRVFTTGTVPKFILQSANLGDVITKNNISIAKFYKDIIRLLILDWQKWGVKVLEAKYTNSKHSNFVNYFGFVLQKDSFTATHKVPKVLVK